MASSTQQLQAPKGGWLKFLKRIVTEAPGSIGDVAQEVGKGANFTRNLITETPEAIASIPGQVGSAIGNKFSQVGTNVANAAGSYVENKLGQTDNIISPLVSNHGIAVPQSQAASLYMQKLKTTPTPTQGQDFTFSNSLANIPNDPGAQYNGIITKASKKYAVPASLLKGVLAHESMQFNPKYVNGYHTDGTGRGIAGIDKVAHPEVSDEQAFDPNYAVNWAANYLSGLKQQEGTWQGTLRRYNGGGNYNSQAPGYEGVPIAQRTQEYANNVYQQAQKFAGEANN